MMRFGFLQQLSVAIACVLCTLQPINGHTEISPDQVLVLANLNSPHSVTVAQYYANRRGIPPSHIISLDVSTHDSVSRQHYEQQVLRPLRRIMQERQLTQQVRVLLCTYGMPLRVLGAEPTGTEQRWLSDATARFLEALARLQQLEQRVREVGVVDRGRRQLGPPGAEAQNISAPLEPVFQQVTHEIREAATRLKYGPEPATREAETLSRLALEFAGIAALVESLKADPSHSELVGKLQFQITAAQRSLQALSQAPSDRNRSRAYELAQRVFGLQGLLRFARVELGILSMRDSDASLDSELSLLWWEPDLFHVVGKVLNPLYAGLAGSSASTPETLQPPLPVLMVSRLDAPTADLAMRLVDQAIEAETLGLNGTVYVDARGLAESPSGFGQYDSSLRALAAMMRQTSGYQVVLENTEQRFSNKGEASGTAVYVGWYRLRSYEDAFTFSPGALGYHIASGEAISLHDPTEPGWCKNALERGITATLGSTGEPLLDAFPLPSRLFGLLLTGRYALVEAYYLTIPYLSWRMVLIGDPLYNPWRRHTGRSDMVKHIGWDALPEPPSARHLSDSFTVMQEIRRQHDATLAQIDHVMPTR